MAKRIGSDSAPTVGAKGKGAPAPNTNKVVTEEFFLKAVKDIGAENDKVKAAAHARKLVRNEFKLAGIQLGLLDATVKMAEWSRGEIRDHFGTAAQYAQWLAMPVAPGVVKQATLATEDDDAIQRREWFALGRTYSRTGKPGRPPEECPDEFHQAFMGGFNEEDEAAWLDADSEKPAPIVEAEPATLAEAAADAIATDTPAEVVAQADAAAPAADEPQDHGQPSWKGYSDDPEDWFAAQWRDFDAWYASLPDGANVRMTHKGVREAFKAKAKAEAEALAAAGVVDDDDAALGEPATVVDEPDAYGLGFAACKADEPRTAIPEDLDEAGVAKWLVGWDARAAQEVDKTPAPPPPARAKARPSKAVH